MAKWFKALVSGTSHFDGGGSNPTSVMLHCHKLTVLLPKHNSKIINSIPSTVLTILAGWLSSIRRCFQVPVISMAWLGIPLLSCYTVTNEQFYLLRNNLKIINNILSAVFNILAGWPSGLRCSFQVLVVSKAWVRIPFLSC